ncbi:transcription initiation factor IIA subunit 2-like [Drosophila rhopaloa]|uniref:Transcription initiation factor IIA gamma subunit C-terminal domain-containing protein n=1 Tax=Drosophila rhopaloa TaxID=1041015 RepID=A0ABM5JDX2_DRORH|nr:transcription initiation factor IIA subunit 2-like [Drosophila rhopaloa]
MTCGHINPDLADTVLIKYDESINEALSKRVTAKVNFRADKLMNYRHCDNVWTLILKDVEFREGPMVLKVDSVKVVACIGLTD